MKKSSKIALFIGIILAGIGVFSAGILVGQYLVPIGEQPGLLGPAKPLPTPLVQYTIPELQKRVYTPSSITVEKELEAFPKYTAYLFSYRTLGRKMTGQLNIPKPEIVPTPASKRPVIVMLRGYVDAEIYKTGVGTRPAAEVFAENGYVTVAPDFFGFGESDKPSLDWEERFEKPAAMIELIQSLRQHPAVEWEGEKTALAPEHVGIWAHSNGGQIALTVLEAMKEPIPTTLWAPVTAPFPFSILFFSDEPADEGKSMRQSLALFEKAYDAQKFSLTQYISELQGPLQLHQGTADDAVPVEWSNAFRDKIVNENKVRKASDSAKPIELTYFTYPGSDHNLRPAWDSVIQRDLAFFAKYLQSN